MKRILLITAICLSMPTWFTATAMAPADKADQTATEQVVAPSQDQALVPSAPETTVKESELAAQLDNEEVAAKKARQQQRANNLKKSDKNGFTLTIMSMCVVLGALAILSVLFLIFGKISKSMLHRKKMAAKGINHKDSTMTKEDLAPGEVIAAISLALHDHFNAHDQEHYDLTIKRMKRAYSPWNSKIYNMREVPVLRKFFK